MKQEHLGLYLLYFTSFILSGLVCLLVYILYTENVSYYPDILTKFSVPCNDISLSPDEDADNLGNKEGFDISVTREGQYICMETNLPHLFNLVFERQSRLRAAKDGTRYLSCGNEELREKSGHLSVAFSKLSERKKIIDDESHTILEWDTDDKHSYIDGSAQYKDGKITIMEGRTYFIYASVHFNISRQDHEHDKYYHGHRHQAFSVRICRNINGYEQTLLGRTKMFNTTADAVVSSMTIGGHLPMTRNDVLYVKVSNANMLLHNSKGNSFGLFPI